MRVCSQCGQQKQEIDFAKDNRRKSGFQACCRKCTYAKYNNPVKKAAARRANGEVKKEYRPRTVYSEADTILIAIKEYHPEGMREYEKQCWKHWNNWVENEAPLHWLLARKSASEGKWPMVGTKMWYRLATDAELKTYRDKKAEETKARYYRNRNKEIERSRNFKTRNPELVRAQSARRYARVDSK